MTTTDTKDATDALFAKLIYNKTGKTSIKEVKVDDLRKTATETFVGMLKEAQMLLDVLRAVDAEGSTEFNNIAERLDAAYKKHYAIQETIHVKNLQDTRRAIINQLSVNKNNMKALVAAIPKEWAANIYWLLIKGSDVEKENYLPASFVGKTDENSVAFIDAYKKTYKGSTLKAGNAEPLLVECGIESDLTDATPSVDPDVEYRAALIGAVVGL